MWVDPLDGTSEFTQGLLDHVTVLIGVAWKGKSIGGVIHQPYYNYQNTGSELGRTMWGLIGLGIIIYLTSQLALKGPVEEYPTMQFSGTTRETRCTIRNKFSLGECCIMGTLLTFPFTSLIHIIL